MLHSHPYACAATRPPVTLVTHTALVTHVHRFIQRPEYVTLNTRFVFREGRTKGIGIVIGTEHEQLPLPPAPGESKGPAAAAGASTGAEGSKAVAPGAQNGAENGADAGAVQGHGKGP
jgi:hypothetical protein